MLCFGIFTFSDILSHENDFIQEFNVKNSVNFESI